MPMSELRNQAFQQEILNMLQPKIKSVLKQTNSQYRLDLEQEISLMIITAIQTKPFQKAPSFFELVEAERKKSLKIV
ncbi:hypothetical protein MHH81_21190 [Psychrobacillus sp. FSL H8-0484]|uniref:hypothetical protein n=1 Tax=Psychrobacillus sp. FSL H8-0484 TaxID=2921390 RepID=UPI0030F6980D